MADLAPFEGLPVTAVGVEMPNAAGGLRDPLKFEPIELHHGDEGTIVLHYRVQKVRFDPVDRDDPGGDQRRVAVLHVDAAMFSDDSDIERQLVEQRDRIARAKEQAEGVQRLATEEELEAQHSDGAHAEGLVDGCPLCDAESDASAAESGA